MGTGAGRPPGVTHHICRKDPLIQITCQRGLCEPGWEEQGGEDDKGRLPHTWPSSTHPQGVGPHLAFMPCTVIQICIGTVHGSVTHGDDPRPGCPVLIGFLERKAQSKRWGGREGGEAGARGKRGPLPTSRLPGGLSLASETVSLPGGGHNEERNILRWRRR